MRCVIRMTKYHVKHNKPDCIGCSACAAVDPLHWEMEEDTGKSTLVDGKEDKQGIEHLKIDESELESMKESAEACPVKIIRILDNKGKQIH
ncbi:ferredoxin [Candidatus Woesearchaeota archaeon]|nr:ferredoxin [Candidatus Woesearchaeota archaeon]